MIARLITSGNVLANNPITFLGRVLKDDGSAVHQADLSAFSFGIYDTAEGASPDPIAQGSITIADSVFDTLQNDDRWTSDAIGYNFRWKSSPSYLPAGGKRYRIEFKLTPISGDPFFLCFEVNTTKVYTPVGP